MAVPTLTDTQIKALKPGDRFYKVTVGGCPGLVLMVFPNGSKIFRLQFTFGGKSQLLTIGPYPGVSLFEARATALLHKENIRKGINPCEEKRSARRKAQANSVTFGDVARKWLAKVEPGWSESHATDVNQKLHRHVLPQIGDKPIVEIGKAEVKGILDNLEANGKLETLKKVRGVIGQVFQYAIINDLPGVTLDPTSLLRARGLFSSHKIRHMSCLTRPADVARLMKAIFAYSL